MRVVVFGGSGFLGSHVADALTDKGYDVIIFDKKQSPYISNKQSIVIGDIMNSKAVNQAVENCDYVYHFAGVSDLDDGSTKPLETATYNVLGTCNILDACIKNNVKKFIYASSLYVQSDKGGFYRCSKQAAEIYIEEYYRKYGIEFAILRYGSLYGPRSSENNSLYKILKSALITGRINYLGDGDETRAFIHVKDATELSVQVLEKNFFEKRIVLTGNISYKMKDIIILIRKILNKNIDITYGNKISDLHYYLPPYDFRPQHDYKLMNSNCRSLEQGLLECIEEINK